LLPSARYRARRRAGNSVQVNSKAPRPSSCRSYHRLDSLLARFPVPRLLSGAEFPGEQPQAPCRPAAAAARCLLRCPRGECHAEPGYLKATLPTVDRLCTPRLRSDAVSLRMADGRCVVAHASLGGVVLVAGTGLLAVCAVGSCVTRCRNGRRRCAIALRACPGRRSRSQGRQRTVIPWPHPFTDCTACNWFCFLEGHCLGARGGCIIIGARGTAPPRVRERAGIGFVLRAFRARGLFDAAAHALVVLPPAFSLLFLLVCLPAVSPPTFLFYLSPLLPLLRPHLVWSAGACAHGRPRGAGSARPRAG
jgi:hypothetical protein